MKLPELERSVHSGRLVPDGKICINETGELAVTKFAVEPGKLVVGFMSDLLWHEIACAL